MSFCTAIELIHPASKLRNIQNLRMAYFLFIIGLEYPGGINEDFFRESYRGKTGVSRGVARELVEELVRFGILTRIPGSSIIRLTPQGTKVAHELRFNLKEVSR